MDVDEIKIRVEGYNLVGRVYWPERRLARKAPLLILCHGIPRGNVAPEEKEQNGQSNSKEEDGGYPALAESCVAEGFPCFHFNFRGTGESEGNFDLPGWGRDLNGVLDYWEKQNLFERFYLWGFSAGAAVSAYVAASDTRVKAVALAACPAEFNGLFPLKDLDSIILRFRTTGIIRDPAFPAAPVSWLAGIHSIKPLNYVAQISPRPLLIIHGTADELVPYEHALKLLARAGEPKQFLSIPRGGHQLRKNREAVSGALAWFKKLPSFGE